jgi:hypothetical protein
MKNLNLNIVNPQPQVVIDQDPGSIEANYVVLS